MLQKYFCAFVPLPFVGDPVRRSTLNMPKSASVVELCLVNKLSSTHGYLRDITTIALVK